MAIFVDRRADSSFALIYDGDLQFDSRDEHVYHEALVLPAVALAHRRSPGHLRALVIGGGDGLATRELLKSHHIIHVELVDRDAAMLELAQTAFAELNVDSLADWRVQTHLQDAWDFVERAIRRGERYDVIIVDLTVPQDMDGARFATIDWFALLAGLVAPAGIIASNAISPSGSPRAFWSIYNSARAADLQVLPLRVALPSFAAYGYGDDWGFLLASHSPIERRDLRRLVLPRERRSLTSLRRLRRSFLFPADSAAHRTTARPTALGSPTLLHYSFNSEPVADATDTSWDALVAAPTAIPAVGIQGLPIGDDTARALAEPIRRQKLEQQLLARVIDLLPALHRDQTRDMIAAFVDSPSRFLRGLDLLGLVNRLLRRAAELPARLVRELKRLRRAIFRFGNDPDRLLSLGMRVVTVVTVVVVVANLLYPDSVYGKGGNPAGPTTAASQSSGGLASPSRSIMDPRLNTPQYASGSGYRSSFLGRSTLDEYGTIYPSRRYYGVSHGYVYHSQTWNHPNNYQDNKIPAQEPDEVDSAFRLAADTDVLPDGRVVIALNDDAYLMIGPDRSILMDQKARQPMLTLAQDPMQRWRTVKEVERQRDGLRVSATAKKTWMAWMGWLHFAPWHEDDVKELANLENMTWRLDQARELLGTVGADPPPAVAPPAANAVEVVSNIWLAPDGKGLILRAPTGFVYLDGKGWYRDANRTVAVSEPYPTQFRTFITNFLAKQVQDGAARTSRLDEDLKLANAEVSALAQDKAEYDGMAGDTAPTDLVEYGSKQVPLQEARRLTDSSLAQAQQQVALLAKQKAALPNEATLTQRVIDSLKP